MSHERYSWRDCGFSQETIDAGSSYAVTLPLKATPNSCMLVRSATLTALPLALPCIGRGNGGVEGRAAERANYYVGAGVELGLNI